MYSKIVPNEFELLVNEAQPSIVEKLSLEDQYLYFKVVQKEENLLSASEVSDFLYNKIYEYLTPVELKIKRSDILKLRSYYIIQHFFSGAELGDYFKVINSLISASTIDFYRPFEDKEEWLSALSLLKDLFIQFPLSYNVEDDEFQYSYIKEKEISKAGIFFKNSGYNLVQNVHGLQLDTDSCTQWISKVKDNIKKLGGKEVIHHIFKFLNKYYDKNLSRYRLYRRTGGILDPVIPADPFGYILNLAIQYIYKEDQNAFDVNEMQKLCIECKHFATLKGVQPYNMIDDTFYDSSNFIEGLVTSITYDSIYTFQQIDYRHIPFILTELFSWIDKSKFEEKFNFSIEQYISVTEALFKLKYDFSNWFTSKEIQVGFSNDRLEKILLCMSHENNLINNGFDFPEDYSKVNFYNKPLVKFDHYYYLADKNWCAVSFINCFAYMCSTIYKKEENFWGTLGFETETVIKRKLDSKNIDYKHGEYDINGIQGQCDLVIEDERRIVFIEVKNKNLTLDARSGNDIKIITDLLYSIVSEMEQAGRHKVRLLREGKIDFKNNDTNIIHNDRDIERVGITFDDYGFIQSKMSVLELLKNISISRLYFYGDIDIKSQNKLNQIIEDFQKNIQELLSIDPEYEKGYLMDCSFFSLPMLLMMIEDSNSTKAFIDNLLLLKFVSFPSKDFYIEYDHWKKLKTDDMYNY